MSLLLSKLPPKITVSCENDQLQIKNHIVPEVYKTYLEDCDIDDNLLSQDDLLYLFGLEKKLV